MALSDAEGAAKRFGDEYASHLDSEGVYRDGVLSTDEMFNSYWYIQNMCAKGYIDTTIWSSDYTSYQVFKKNGKYTAEVWNPFDKEITVHFANENGALGSVKVPAHATVDCDPTKNEDKTVDANGNKVKYEPVKDYDPVNKVSGVVEAEDYYTNFSCEPATDANEGGYVGWIDDGDSLVYTIDVKEEADYVVDYRVQCVNTEKNSAIKLKTDNDNDYILTTYLDNSTTEWKNVKADKTVHLKAGKYQMKLMLVDGGFNLNYVKIYKKGTKAPIAASDDVTKADLSEYPEISLNSAKVIDVTSEANDAGKAANMIDGDYSTRWESVAEDPQAFTVELESEQKIGGMKIYWEGAAAKKYVVETSTDNTNWSTAFTQNRGKGGQGNGDENRSTGLEAISFDKVMTAKYVRVTCLERLTGYGDSIYELKLYGKGPDQKDKLDAPTAKAVLGKDEITVSWNAVANADSYVVYRTSPMNTNEMIATVNGTSYTDSELTENGNYTYWVVAVPKDGSDDYTSSEYSVATEEITYTKTEQGGETEEPGEIVVDSKDLAAGKTATASSMEGENVAPKYAVDGDANTRWSSEFTDDEWISVDLGKIYSVRKVVLTWEAAYGKDYDIQVSTDGDNWTTVKEMRNQDGGEDVIEFEPVNARHVRMKGVARAIGYGYSLWSMEVFSGKSSQQPTEPETPKPTEPETEEPTTTPVSGINVAQGKDIEQSGAEATAMGADKAVDGNKGTRWSSNFDDDAWMYVDLGRQIDINKVVITWENAYGKAYDIQVSNDAKTWTTVAEMRDQDGGEDVALFKTVNARYVKFQGVKRAMGYGYSMWEFEVFAK